MLPTQRIDIILGMNWMEGQGVSLDTTSQSVHIKSSIHGCMTLHLKDHMSLTPTVNQVEGKKLADIPVVCEYPDVFPDDLPGMPPDRDGIQKSIIHTKPEAFIFLFHKECRTAPR